MLRIKQASCTIDPRLCPQDLYSVLNPITKICRILGIFPLSLKSHANKRKYSTSYVSIVYSLTILVLMLASSFAWEEESINKRLMNISQQLIIHMTACYELILQMGSMLVMVSTSIFNKNKFANTIETLNGQDISLCQLGTRIDYAKDLKQKYIHLGIIISILLALCTYDFYYQSELTLWSSLNWMARMNPNISRIASAWLFIDVVILLEQRFAALNVHLLKMIQETKDYQAMTISTSLEKCERIRSIAMVHGVLCEVASSLNETFNCNIIAGVVYVSIKLTSSTYFLYRELIEQNISMVDTLVYSNWLIIFCSLIVRILSACHFTQNQASLTGKLIHKFQPNGFDTTLRNVVRKKMRCILPKTVKIQSFSLQLHHEKIEFSGAGFFPLNATLIQSIVGTVTTNLIILIQFDTSMAKIPAPK